MTMYDTCVQCGEDLDDECSWCWGCNGYVCFKCSPLGEGLCIKCEEEEIEHEIAMREVEDLADNWECDDMPHKL